MKFSYNWIKELSGTEKTAEEIAKLFLTHSFEVEGIDDLSKGLDKVVVGEVLSVEKHPDADRLNVAQVRIGSDQVAKPSDLVATEVGDEKNKVLQIVCGAPNLETGQKVPVALVGAKLPNGDDFFEIKKSKIRGVESNGMICAEDELGIGDNHEGIMVLKDEASVGQDFAEYMQLNDKILDIDILPNRGHDCLGYNGIALELNALENDKSQMTNNNSVTNDKILNEKKTHILKVDIDTENCSRYAGVKIKNIKLAPSPLWMQARLKASGLKPINNIVDITNYVMLETGQPLHAFDAKSVQVTRNKSQDTNKSQNTNSKIQIGVRQAKDGEKITLLDEQELELVKDDIVITDGEKLIALAGVMGGLESGIKDDTKEIILEGANFNSSSIRFTARRHNLQTDAAYRFERDIDPNFVDIALSRAAELIQELAQGEVETITDIYPEPIKPWTINLSLDYVRRLLGVEISDEEISSILERLGVDVKSQKSKVKSQDNLKTPHPPFREKGDDPLYTGGVLDCIIPTRRRDLRTEEDLIEEVGRIYGYDKIKPEPIQAPVQTPHRNEQRFLERDLKNIAVQSGFSEIRSYSFHSEEDAKILGLDNLKHIELLNPASPEQLMLRNTLAVGLLKAGRKSLSYFPEVRIFEIGKVYKAVDKVLPEETVYFGGAVFSKNKNGEQFYELKGLVDNLLQGLGIEDYYYDDTIEQKTLEQIPNLHPSRRAVVKTESGKIIGWLGETTKQENKYFGLKNVRGALLSLDVEKLLELSQEKNSFQPLSKFPFTERDISMIVPEKMRIKEVEDVLFKAGSKLLKDVDLFDLYYNEKTGERSMAFHLLFGNEEKTLQAKEVDTELAKIIEVIKKELGVEVKK